MARKTAAREPSQKEILRAIRRIQRDDRGAGASDARGGYDVGKTRTVEYLAQLFTAAKFDVQKELDLGVPGVTDLIVGREFLGLHRRYVIEVALVKEAADLLPRIERLSQFATARRGPDEFDEFWLVSNLSLPERAQNRPRLRRVRAFTLKELEGLLARLNPKPPSRSPKGKARTKIGKAIEANEAAINLAITGLILQIEDKLEALRQDRPNSDEAKASRDARRSDFERIRAELENIRTMVAAFTKGDAKEKEVVKSVTTFRDGIQNWWHNGHEVIINKTFDAGLFLSSVGVLSLMNADLKIGMVVSGALIAGKSIAGGMKGLKRGAFRRLMRASCGLPSRAPPR